jgi:WD40-like Beta Propeller Repeat
MSPLTRLSRCTLLGCAIAVIAASAASADIIAAVEVPSPDGTNSDIALMNAATGAKPALPAGVNTDANELHPSITPDGKRLVFQRISQGTDRIVVTDLASHASADLYDAFAAQQQSPQTPFIAADGSSVVTGGPFQTTAALTSTPLGAFPGGPFTHTPGSLALGVAAGQLLDPIARGSITAAALQTIGGPAGSGSTQIVLHSATHDLLYPSASTTFYADPALDGTDGIAVYEHAVGSLNPYTLRYRSSDPGVAAGSDTAFPAIVNAPGSGFSETHPAFTPDDRYLGFVRLTVSTQAETLFVFDTQTQTLVNPGGVALGSFPVLSLGYGVTTLWAGGLSLREQQVFLISSLLPSGLLAGRLLAPTGVGILVQRIVGHHRLLGRTVPTLKTVGRVPLGHHPRGKFAIRWDHRVGGHKLARGRYLVTLRAVAKNNTVTELGKSFTVRIS